MSHLYNIQEAFLFHSVGLVARVKDLQYTSAMLVDAVELIKAFQSLFQS